jgi:hypothetical protein
MDMQNRHRDAAWTGTCGVDKDTFPKAVLKIFEQGNIPGQHKNKIGTPLRNLYSATC